MLETIGNLRAWQILVIIAVWVLGIAGSFAAYQLATGTDDTPLAALGEDQQLYSVATGDLVNEVSVSGGLVFPNREALNFEVQGTVGRVLVGEGDFVAQGQVLAVLDDESIAKLEKAVAQAEVDLRDALDALDEALAPYTALDVARAESAVANAEVDLKTARDDLAAVMEPSVHAVAKAEAKVASSRVAVSAAKASLESSKEPPSSHQIVSLEAKITDARVKVADASEALDLLMAGAEEDVRGDAQAKIDSAQADLRIARMDLSLTSDDWVRKLDEEADLLEEARDRYAAVFLKWLGIELTEAERDIDTDTLLDSWNADLESLFVQKDPLYGLNLPLDDPATRWNELPVYLWAHFFPGTVFATCESTDTARGPCVKGEMDAAWEVIGPIEDTIERLTKQEQRALANAASVVARAAENLDEAEEALAALLVEPGELEVEAKQVSLQFAQSELREAENDLVELMAEPDVSEIADREARIAQDEAELGLAESELADLTAPPDEIDVRAAGKRIGLTAATLADAQETLAEILEGADGYVVALREADVTASSAALESARGRLEQTTITAPWAGVISTIEVEAGQQVGTDILALEIVDESILEVQGVVDEIDVLFVREGLSASVTMDALPGQSLNGVVSDIAAVANGQEGIVVGERGTTTGTVSYAIGIRVEKPPGLSLREGLSALASVAIREDRGVLLVPLDAVYGSFDQPVLRVMNNGEIEERPVALGNSDDFWVAVESGIFEGDLVVMQSRQASDGFGGFGGLLGGFGRGRPGPSR